MSLTTKLNSLESLPDIKTVKMSDLCERGYMITSCKKIQTKHGAAVVVHLDMNGSTVSAFLPKRFVDSLEESDIAEIDSTKCYNLQCLGMVGRSANVKIWKA